MFPASSLFSAAPQNLHQITASHKTSPIRAFFGPTFASIMFMSHVFYSMGDEMPVQIAVILQKLTFFSIFAHGENSKLESVVCENHRREVSEKVV